MINSKTVKHHFNNKVESFFFEIIQTACLEIFQKFHDSVKYFILKYFSQHH
jgi:hypothetical protein